MLSLLVTTNLAGQLSSTGTHQSKKLYDIFGKSNLHDIQLFIHGLADLDAQYLQIVRQALEVSNMADKLATADAEDIGHFLWNIYAFVSNDLAQAYCKLVDAQDMSNLLSSVSLEDLCRFLWNLAHISDLPELQTLENPAVTKRLQVAWENQIVLGMNLLGILSITSPDIARDLQLPLIETQQKEDLKTWLIQLGGEQLSHPRTLALTLHGLRSYNELEAQAIVSTSLDFSKTILLLEGALVAPIITPRSIALLQEVNEWLRKLLAHANEDTHKG